METCAASVLGGDRHRVEGSGRTLGTPRRPGHRADDSHHTRQGRPVARSSHPVAHNHTRPGGHNKHRTEENNHLAVLCHTGEPWRPGTGGSGLDLSGKGLHVGRNHPVDAAVAAAGADTAVLAAAGERAAAVAGAAAAAGTAAKADTAAAADKAAAAGTTAAAVGTAAAAGAIAAAADRAAAAETMAAAAGKAAAAAGSAAVAGSAAAEAVGVVAAARSAAVGTDVAVVAAAAAAAAVSAGVAEVEHKVRPVQRVVPVGVHGPLRVPYRLGGRWAPVYRSEQGQVIYLSKL